MDVAGDLGDLAGELGGVGGDPRASAAVDRTVLAATVPAAMSRRRTRAPRTWPQRLLIGLNCLLVVACLAAAAGFSFVQARIADLNVVSGGLSLAPEAAPDVPRNILIIGTDNADRLGEKDPVRRDRGTGELLADVIMILRLDPTNQQARLISIPRDTYLPTAPFGTKQRINATIYGPDGPQHLIQTIKDNFAISIDNYVEIDFAGFRQLVQILDGVPVYLTAPVRDRNTGLFQPEPGCVTLDPVQALAYARSRHFQYKVDGKWIDDPSGDLGRISRQQDFIKRAAKRAIDRGARNPATALELVTAASGAITIDETLTVGEMRDLVTQFRNFNVDQLDSTQVPTKAAPLGGVAYQAVIWDEAWPLLAPFWGDATGDDLGPRDFVVTVAPRSRGMQPADVVTALEQHGIDGDVATSAATVGATVGKRVGTTIAFGPDGRDAAKALARWLDASDLDYVFDSTLPGRRVVLSVGAGLSGVRSEQTAAADVEDPPAATSTTSRPTTTAPKGTGSSSTDSGSTESIAAPTTTVSATTTSVPGVVPTDPEAELRCNASS